MYFQQFGSNVFVLFLENVSFILGLKHSTEWAILSMMSKEVHTRELRVWTSLLIIHEKSLQSDLKIDWVQKGIAG